MKVYVLMGMTGQMFGVYTRERVALAKQEAMKREGIYSELRNTVLNEESEDADDQEGA